MSEIPLQQFYPCSHAPGSLALPLVALPDYSQVDILFFGKNQSIGAEEGLAPPNRFDQIDKDTALRGSA